MPLMYEKGREPFFLIFISKAKKKPFLNNLFWMCFVCVCVKTATSNRKKTFHFMSSPLKSHVKSLGEALSPLEFFWEVFLFKMGRPKFFCMFSSKFVARKKFFEFSTFVVFENFCVKNWKLPKLGWFQQISSASNPQLLFSTFGAFCSGK